MATVVVPTTAAGTGRPAVGAAPPPFIRETVRALLLSAPAFQELEPDRRRALASAMVRVCALAAALVAEEVESDQAVRALGAAGNEPVPAVSPDPVGRGRPIARTQAAEGEFGAAAGRVAGVTRNILNAVSFPRFVTELINGVFKAMIDSSIQQMQAYVELLNNVAASIEGFADANIGPDRARAWLAERYPAAYEVEGAAEAGEEVDPEEPAERRLRLRPGAAPPSEAALRTDLGLGENETVPSGDPDRGLVPLARRRLAAMRQQTLATMVMLGMQRIVVESGRIQAAMRFHIDTRDAARADQGSTFNLQNQINASGGFGVGPWGASASISNTIGYVSTQRTQATQEMNTDLELTSSVEINFRSDYLPLNQLSGRGQTDRIIANSLNPEGARAAEQSRRTAQLRDEALRSQETNALLAPRQGAAPRPGDPGTIQDAQRARQEAQRRETGQPAANQNAGTRGTPPRPAATQQPGTQPPPAAQTPQPAAQPAPARSGNTAVQSPPPAR